jgi:gas vesicle protein
MSNNNMNGKDFLLGAVVGGVLGAVTALLLAPKSGRELRTDIADGYHTVSDKTQEIAGTVSQKSQEIAGTVGQKSQEIAGVVSERSQEIAKTVGTHTSEWAGKAKDAASTVAGEIKSWKKEATAADSEEDTKADKKEA